MASLRQVCYPSQQQQLNRYFKNTTKHSLKRDVFLLSEWPHQCVSLLSVSVDRPHCLLCALVSSDGSSRVSHFAGSLVARVWGEPSVSEPSRPRSGRARSSCLSVHSVCSFTQSPHFSLLLSSITGNWTHLSFVLFGHCHCSAHYSIQCLPACLVNQVLTID